MRVRPLLLVSLFVPALVAGCELHADFHLPDLDPGDYPPIPPYPPPPPYPDIDAGPGNGPDAGEYPEECWSEVAVYGYVCTTCQAYTGAEETECLPAQCGVFSGCLECFDPKGRYAVDCSIDWESVFIASLTWGSGDTFNSCITGFGDVPGAATTCHYPGPSSCSTSQHGEARCIDCTYHDGSSRGTCLLDPDEPLPDPLAGRPDILPPPGQCFTDQISQEGRLNCTTCTRDDLSAIMSCIHPPALDCGDVTDPEGTCMTCQDEDGTTTQVCDPPAL